MGQRRRRSTERWGVELRSSYTGAGGDAVTRAAWRRFVGLVLAATFLVSGSSGCAEIFAEPWPPRLESVDIWMVSPSTADVIPVFEGGFPEVCVLVRETEFGDRLELRREAPSPFSFHTVPLPIPSSLDGSVSTDRPLLGGEVRFWLELSCTFGDGSTSSRSAEVWRDVPGFWIDVTVVETEPLADTQAANVRVSFLAWVLAELPRACVLERTAHLDGAVVDAQVLEVVPAEDGVVERVPLVADVDENRLTVSCSYEVDGVAWVQEQRWRQHGAVAGE